MNFENNKYKEFYIACEVVFNDILFEAHYLRKNSNQDNLKNNLREFGHLMGDLHNKIVEKAKLHLVDQDDYNTQILIDTQDYYLERFEKFFN